MNEHTHDHRAEQAMLWIKAILLIGLAAYFAYNILSGSLTNYINYRFAWLSYVAAAIFALLGVYSVLVAVRAMRDHEALHEALEHDHASGDHADHDHAGLSWTNLAILSIPLLLGLLIPSQPLGASAINGSLSTSASGPAVVGSTTTFSVSPLDRNVLDWLRAFGSAADVHEIDGQPADVIGFVYKEPSFAADQFMVARFAISCCVADATALGLPTTYPDAADLEQGVWVRVQGSFQAGTFREDTMPILQAASVEIVDQPDHPYLYP